MEGLDKNILNLILGHVETKDDLLDCTLVCKRWTHISRKQIIQQFYKDDVDDDDPYIQLCLEFKDLTMLPVEIGCLTDLEVLNVKCNQLSILPATLINIDRLRKDPNVTFIQKRKLK